MDFETFVHFNAGVLSGAAGVLAGHPLDTVKVRLQTQSHGQYRGTWHCFTTIVKKENVKGLYKGLSSPLSSLTLVNAIVFGVHGNIAKNMGENSVQTHFIAGCAAGMAQAVIAAPTELLKLRIQIQDEKHLVYRSPYHCARQLIEKHGTKTLFRGMTSTIVRDCPAFGIYFASYEWMARKLSRDGTMEALTSAQLLIAGGAAGMLSWLFNYPSDVIKTRFQACDSYKSYADVIRRTYAEDGIRTFYRGLGSTLLRAFPSNAATFFTVEWTYRLLLDLQVLRKENDSYSHSHRHALEKNYILLHDLWQKNSFLLPEAGSTIIDPMIHGSRFF
ncbi:hypothetical protein QR680_004989 [Steinernema hermaphroditum]|uniref:Mitochondrial basic amino acids transporter n=1 Tax=Steinernema hermaphroditum TaxID=289476 RepID=A0AA39HQG4_9BILA|nr:hypothetical protein QR680_004989 [Steinernema hermaphroditum]